jgi:membrane-associated protease RseP (regulator of RpoE activity)
MADSAQAEPVLPPDTFAPVFAVDRVRVEGDTRVYYGERLAPPEVVRQHVRPQFEKRGYEVTLSQRAGEHVVVAEPASRTGGVPWVNLLLLLVTTLSTLYAGSLWYGISQPLSPPTRLLGAWPFAAAVMSVLGVHELGHYLMSRYHGVDASLPYFIPLPITVIGTAGAVIRIRDRMPDRKALFDIGVAGPLAGLLATVVVTVIGLSLPPLEASGAAGNTGGPVLVFNNPPLLDLIATAIGEQTGYVNDPGKRASPVVFGGWVGMFITFLNLLPVGQLDGGHITRAVFGKRSEAVSMVVPGLLFGLAGYLYYFQDLGSEIGVWVFWGVFTILIARAGSADPVRDAPLDTRRKAIGVVTLFLGLLCFTPVPVEIMY